MSRSVDELISLRLINEKMLPRIYASMRLLWRRSGLLRLMS